MTEDTLNQPVLCGPPSGTKRTALQRAEILRKAEVFSKATVEQLLFLAAIACEVHFDPETMIFREGEIADAIYVIIEGKVERIHEPLKEILEPFGVIGLYAVLTGEPRYASARALEKTFTLKIGSQDFFDLLSHNTEIVQSLFKILIQQIPHKKGC